MRNFLIASAAVSIIGTKVADFQSIADGAIGMTYTDAIQSGADAGKYDMLNAAAVTDAFKRGQIVLGATDVEGNKRPYVLPFYRHNFSFSHMTYHAPTNFSATVKVGAPVYSGTHTIMIVKKGVPFNERNKWSADVYVRDSSISATLLAKMLAVSINNNSESSGVIASVSADTITITAKTVSEDYDILLADELTSTGSVVTITSPGLKGIADAEMIKDMANKAAADAGFNDTYQDAAYLYPHYPIDRATNPLSKYGYDVFTLRFAEPREMKTRDEVVHQIVQIAFPRTSAGANAQVANFNALLNALV